MKLFVTGKPGVGKTTLVKRLYSLAPDRFRGFWTEEVREGGRRVGFKVITTEGGEGVLAHVGIDSPYRVGRYGVSVREFERVVLPVLEPCIPLCPKVVLIDEIGKMELFSERFAGVVEGIAFRRNLKVVATVPLKDVHPLVRRIRRRFRPVLLTLENREEVFRVLAGRLGLA